MASVFRALSSSDAPIFVPAVERVIEGETGYFDYYVYQHPQAAYKLVWLLIDKTSHYTQLRVLQQMRNEQLLMLEQSQTSLTTSL